MKITPLKTHAIVAKGDTILDILDKYLPRLSDGTVIVITSKIISLCEGSAVAATGEADLEKLVIENSDYYLPKSFNKYGFNFTITNNTMIASAGIDQSNGNGNYVLWPKDPQASANNIREHLIAKHRVPNIGVIITDSKTIPLRWGTVGTSIAYSGFLGLHDYRGTTDLFNYEMRVTKANIVEGLAAAACVGMGEGNESTPLAIIENVPFVKFQKRNPSAHELKSDSISLEEDLYAPILTAAPWKKGKKNS
jgi:F420-0:gamma-glutamyl ligase